MNTKLWRFALALLPICFLSAQQPSPQAPQQLTNRPGFHQPSPEAMRKIAEQRRIMEAHANTINDVAGRIHSPDDARQLVDLVAAEFSDELPPGGPPDPSASASPRQSMNPSPIPVRSSPSSTSPTFGTISLRKSAPPRTPCSPRPTSIIYATPSM